MAYYWMVGSPRFRTIHRIDIMFGVFKKKEKKVVATIQMVVSDKDGNTVKIYEQSLYEDGTASVSNVDIMNQITEEYPPSEGYSMQVLQK